MSFKRIIRKFSQFESLFPVCWVVREPSTHSGIPVENTNESKSLYAHGLDVIGMTFTMGENNSVNANGSFVLFDELTSISTPELLEYLGAYSVEVDIVAE